MKVKFWWLDNSDIELSRKKLSFVRKEKFSGFEWVRWSESDYEKTDAIPELVRNIGTCPMFSKGKVVICYGIPKCQSKVAECLSEIADNVIFIIVARPDTRIILYKTAKNMGDSAKLDCAINLTKSNVIEWVKDKASEINVEIEDHAAKMLIDFIGNNPSSLGIELRKLSHLTLDGKIHPWVIEQGCSGTGRADILELSDFISQGNFLMAHEFLDRILDKGESVERICGFFSQWIRKMAISESCNGNFENVKKDLSCIIKFEKPDKDAKKRYSILKEELSHVLLNDKKKVKKVNSLLKKEREKIHGSSSPMFPKPGALFYSCKNFNSIKGKPFWTYLVIRSFGYLMLDLRKSKKDRCSPRQLLHLFIWNIQGEIENVEQGNRSYNRD